MKRIINWGKSSALVCLLYLTGCGGAANKNTVDAQQCFENSANQFNEVMTCYRAAQAMYPLQYLLVNSVELPGVQKRSFKLTSQNWSPNGLVQPEVWNHDVDIYIPSQALHGTAVLIANNGINIAATGAGLKPGSDFSEATAVAIAQKTRTIIVSVSNVPNQQLTYLDDGLARKEDSSVAHSWKLFLQSPQTRPFVSLHVPMMESLVKAMDLAVQELQPWQIQRFIATGASKRAWAVWLAAIADNRIDAVAPFVIDILSMDKVLEHTRQTYGGNWPLAFGDYLREGIVTQRKSDSFSSLLQMEDPLHYLHSAYAKRLEIPKYMINASGDDFFVPDNSRLYFDQLPGVKALRVAPNSDHHGILDYVETSLIALVNRLQRHSALPTLTVQQRANGITGGVIKIGFSETPLKVVQWVASNPVARDFRYACGIRYQAIPVAAAKNLTVSIAQPAQGWNATFVEAHFADGFVMTSQVQIVPENYPTAAPPDHGSACKTIAEP